MENQTVGWIALGVLIATGLTTFFIYRWRQEVRVSQIKDWINKYLNLRYGELPADIRIICSRDSFWPVLVSLDTPGIGIRHILQFACQGTAIFVGASLGEGRTTRFKLNDHAEPGRKLQGANPNANELLR